MESVCCACCCVQVLASVQERVEAAEKTIASWAEDKPWINENDTKSVVEKVGPWGRGGAQGMGGGLWGAERVCKNSPSQQAGGQRCE